MMNSIESRKGRSLYSSSIIDGICALTTVFMGGPPPPLAYNEDKFQK